MKFSKIVITGSLAFDHIMSMPGRFKDHILPEKIHILNISFIMTTLRKEYGGTAGNQAYNLTLLGIKPKMAAAAGSDFSDYKKHLIKSRVDISGVKIFKDVLTATGFVTTDKDDNQIWGFYEGAMKHSVKLNVKKWLSKKTFLVIAPNEPRAMMKYVREAVSIGAEFLFDPAFIIPHFTKKDLRLALGKAKIIIGNDYEIALIRKRAQVSDDFLTNKGKTLITTLGAKGSIIQRGKERIKIPAARAKNTSDPTGAGDAYRAGFLAGYLRGLSLSICGRMGSLAAVYTVEKYGTQTHRFTIREFERRYENNFEEKISLINDN